MSWFSRRSARQNDEVEEATEPTESDPPADSPADAGPRDVSEVTSRGTRLDLGALWVPVSEQSTIRLDIDKKSGRLVAVNIAQDGANLRLQVFAAPKTSGIWDEVRQEMAASIESGGGNAEEVDGPFGTELRAKVPSTTRDGRTGKRSVRFVGVDGPRWFVRAEFSGKAATNAQAAEPLEELLKEVVVSRGTEAHPPRELLTLTMPGSAQAAQATPDGRPPLSMPGRGPEIAEIR
ncbi:MAG: DUF3710 domain-containing protein [Bifidobacteriaceae bacterium]|jgi:hypothetical protein|nr:DUF3710 domain-containing protein [Bifidobacteriaceae bacterium]